MSRPVRVGVVGVGDFGVRHAEVVAAVADAELVGVADPDRDRVGEVAARLGTRAFSGVEALVADGDVEAVVVATPQSRHLADLRVLLAAGVPSLVEKPVVASAHEADRLLELTSAWPQVLVMPAHVSRYAASFDAARRHLQGQEVQAVRAIRVVPRERLALHGGEHPALVAMVHDLDLVRALVSADLVDVTSVQRWTEPEAPHPQIVMAHLRFADGTLASVENHWTQPHSRSYIDARMEVVTPTGQVRVTLPGGGLGIATADGDAQPDTELDAWVAGQPVGALGTQLRHFVSCVRGGVQSTMVSLDDALWSARVAARIADQTPPRG